MQDLRQKKRKRKGTRERVVAYKLYMKLKSLFFFLRKLLVLVAPTSCPLGKLNFEEKIKAQELLRVYVLPLLLKIAMMDEERRGEKNKLELSE